MKCGGLSFCDITDPGRERYISLFQKFADEYGAYMEALSDEQVVEILGGIDDPRFGSMLNELRKRYTKRALRKQ